MTSPTPPDSPAAGAAPAGVPGLAPVERSVTVRSGIEHTFDVFVRRLDEWWPTRTHSLGLERVRGVVFEERVGGRVYEVRDDGTEETWGEVLAFDRPHRFRITWDIAAGTEVEVTFRALGPALTRVRLEHAGWERLTVARVEAATRRGSYHEGWGTILQLYLAAAEA
jgi:uncharacterized protein YndB with AHSA1/START domain